MIEKKQNMEHIFYAPKTEKFIGNHLEKILSPAFIIPVYYFLRSELNYSNLLLIMFVYITPLFFFVIIQRKFTHKIVIDFDSQKILFHMYRNNILIKANFAQIERIGINGYVIFKLHNRRVFYKDLNNNNFLDCINRIKKIEWGILCSIWGPSKKIRNKLKFDTEK